MKNIVLTFHREVNYGAIFQTVALQTVLKRYGETALLDFDMKKELGKPSLKKIIYMVAETKKSFVLQKFLKKHAFLTKKVSNIDDIQRICNTFDNLFVGSDQVWAKDIVGSYYNIYTLNFPLNKNVRKISYAASIGKDIVDGKDVQELVWSLKDYKSISVRENSAKKVFGEYGLKDVMVTLDPTLLLDSNSWDSFSSTNNKYSKYIFVYMLEINKDIIKSVKELRDKTNLKVICLNNKNHFGDNTICIPFCSPNMFLSLIKNADYVITNSFHGTCFSIIYNKKFGVHLHTTKSVRQRELLDKLDLNYAIINDDIEKIIDNDYKYTNVNRKLNDLRKKSLAFIEKSIGDSDE